MTTRPWWLAGADWTVTAEWWTSPATAYLAGLVHGAQLQAAADGDTHRDVVREALEFIARCEARDPRLDRRRAS